MSNKTNDCLYPQWRCCFSTTAQVYSVKALFKLIGWNVSLFSLNPGITALWVIVLNGQRWKGQIDVNLLKWTLTLFSGSESLFLNCCINIKPVFSAQILIHPAEGATLHVLSCRSQRLTLNHIPVFVPSLQRLRGRLCHKSKCSPCTSNRQ